MNDAKNSSTRLSNGRQLASNQSGFTIVELMIAGLLGIILTAGVIQLFIGSNRNYTLQDELANVQENGRFALIFLKEQIQRGGWVEEDNEEPVAPIVFANSSDGDSDAITISYQLSPNSMDCNGAEVLSGLIQNRIFVGGASGKELLCQGNGGRVAQPFIDGVENFQVLYGVESNPEDSDGALNQYMTLTQVNAAAGTVKVVAVRVALLLATENAVKNAAESKTYNLLDTQFTPIADNRFAYRTFQQTIYMPNALFPLTRLQ